MSDTKTTERVELVAGRPVLTRYRADGRPDGFTVGRAVRLRKKKD